MARATEILAGVIVALKPRYGAYVVDGWLAGIIINLPTYSGFYDIALRDFGSCSPPSRSRASRPSTTPPLKLRRR